MLRGANHRTLSRVELIKLPRGTTSILIGEQEPEITYLERISVTSETDESETVLAENITIPPGAFRKFAIPEMHLESPILSVHGYYRPLRLEGAISSAP